MSRDPRYQKMLNSKRWWDVKRIVWQRAGGLCERCKAEGYVRSGVDCHHIVPVETAKTIQEMERLAYDPDNCRLLCIDCHVKTHKELNSHKWNNIKERRKLATERWRDSMINRFTKQEKENKS